MFHRPQLIPFAVKDAVDRELDRLQQAGIVEKVTHSDLAVPILLCQTVTVRLDSVVITK